MNIGGLVKNSFVDYPNKICCVVFTNGCNMDCWFCHNKHLVNCENKSLLESDVLNFLKTHKPFLDAVTISGGEPTIQKDLIDFIKKVKDLGYLVKLDTNGTNYDVLKNLIDNKLINYVAMDIKAPLEDYNKITKCVDIDSIKRSINLLKTGVVCYEFRTTFAPNLTKQDIIKIAQLVNGADTYVLQQYRQVEEPKQNISKNFNNYLLQPLSEKIFFDIKKEAQKYVKNMVIKGL